LWRRENDTFMCEHFAHVLSFNFNKSKSLIASNGHIFLPHRWGTYLLPHPSIHQELYTLFVLYKTRKHKVKYISSQDSKLRTTLQSKLRTIIYLSLKPLFMYKIQHTLQLVIMASCYTADGCL
jgi:hypothetical protein